MAIFILMIPVLIMGFIAGRMITLEDERNNIYLVWHSNKGKSPVIEVFREEEPARIYMTKCIGRYDNLGWIIKTYDGKDISRTKE